MERREFITKSGAVFTAAMFSNFFINESIANTSGSNNDKQEKQYNRRPNPNDFQKPALMAIAFGINAPNPHNTQAWKFKLINDDEFLFFVDENRLLTATDPPSRQMHIGCGCFLATLQHGISAKGYTSEVELFHEGTYSLSQTGEKPVARVKISKSNIQPSTLSNVLFSRKTNRLKYQGEMVSRGEFEKITANIPNRHSSISLENEEPKMGKMIDILYRGMEIECRTHDTYEESRFWFRLGDDKALKRDGINLDGTVDGKLLIKVMEMAMKGLDHDTWHKEKNINIFLKNYQKAIGTAKGLVWFKTDTNTHFDWVKTGMDYANFQLSAYKMGMYIHPMSQVLQEYKEMDELRDEFNSFMKVSEPEKIQMIIRIGRSKEPFYSYRKDVKDFIV